MDEEDNGNTWKVSDQADIQRNVKEQVENNNNHNNEDITKLVNMLEKARALYDKEEN